MPLTDRQKDILQAIIRTHITTASAVGSRTVAKKMGFKLSPASVRNVMADLEEMGYVRQPHTSAGRIPTDTGYRLYVDCLMEMYEIAYEEQSRVDELYGLRLSQIEELLELTSRLLAILTNYTAVVQTPRKEQETIRHIELILLTSLKLLVILVTNMGEVRKRISVLPRQMTDLEAGRLANFLNEKLCDLSLASARSLMDSFDFSGESLDADQAKLTFETIEELLSEDKPRDLYLDGMVNIFAQPEFRAVERLQPLLRVLDEKKQVNELLECCVPEDVATGICISIGSEIPVDDVRNCSIIASPYRICGRLTGAIGVIGPTRMRYSRTSSLVAFVADKLGHVLTILNGGG